MTVEPDLLAALQARLDRIDAELATDRTEELIARSKAADTEASRVWRRVCPDEDHPELLAAWEAAGSAWDDVTREFDRCSDLARERRRIARAIMLQRNERYFQVLRL